MPTLREAQERHANYFLHLAASAAKDFHTLSLEKANILPALDAALKFKLVSPFIQGVNAVLTFLNSTGLQEQAQFYLEQALVVLGRSIHTTRPMVS